MRIFKLKTSDANIYNQYVGGQDTFVVDHLIQYDDVLSIGDPIFFSFGGDNCPWTNGLYAIGRIDSAPLDLGYEVANRGANYYRLRIRIELRLGRVWEKSDFIRYPESFDSGVAPSTRGERNQALGLVNNDTPRMVASICRAIIDNQAEHERPLRQLFGDEIIDYAMTETIVFSQENRENGPDVLEENVEPVQKIVFGAPGTGKSNFLKCFARQFETSDGWQASFRRQLAECRNGNENTCAWCSRMGYLYRIPLSKYLTEHTQEDLARKFDLSQTEKDWMCLTARGNTYGMAERDLDLTSITERVERVTFHPNYSYAQFVGTYKPVQNLEPGHESEIQYKFVPGPFLRVYKKACLHPYEKYLLIIEEINRANVAAVFGDVFQLLDRKNGVSEYPVTTSEDVRRYLQGVGGDGALQIPKNMFIWATMNSADQGVFPMDTAFKRRWEFEYVDIDNNQSEVENYLIPVQNNDSDYFFVKWNELRHKINDKLSNLGINEDKLMGAFFVNIDSMKDLNEELALATRREGDVGTGSLDNPICYTLEATLETKVKSFRESFCSKVLMYLFEDAARMHRPGLFANGGTSLRYSDICRKFKADGLATFNFDER